MARSMTSAPILAMVLTVSIRPSPFLTLLDEAEIFTELALMYFLANSKDSRVLVLFS